MAKYGKKAAEKVEKTMHERKRGTLRSSSGQKVTSRKQAIAIGLSEARRAGGKVPKPKAGTARKKNGTSTKKRTTTRKAASSTARKKSTTARKASSSTTRKKSSTGTRTKRSSATRTASKKK